MGLFSVRVKVKAPGRQAGKLVTALVSTGAAISVIPARTLKALNVKPYWHRRFVLANSAGTAARAPRKSCSVRNAINPHSVR